MGDFFEVFVINGSAGAGKDTLIKICQEELSPQGIYVYSASAVDQIKEAALRLGWDGVKDARGRQLLFDLKMLSVAYNDGPTEYLLSRVRQAYESLNDGIFFLHIREPEEIAKIMKRWPRTKLLHIHRESEVFVNGADERTMEIEYDYYIDNNGSLEELRAKCRELLKQLLAAESRELRDLR